MPKSDLSSPVGAVLKGTATALMVLIAQRPRPDAGRAMVVLQMPALAIESMNNACGNGGSVEIASTRADAARAAAYEVVQAGNDLRQAVFLSGTHRKHQRKTNYSDGSRVTARLRSQ